LKSSLKTRVGLALGKAGGIISHRPRRAVLAGKPGGVRFIPERGELAVFQIIICADQSVEELHASVG